MTMMPDTAIDAREAETQFNKKHFFNGKYDRRLFLSAFTREFGADKRYNPDCNVAMSLLLGQIERDSTVTDIRWAAYMLATAFIETGRRGKREVPVLDTSGSPTFSRKGKPITRYVNVWQMMSPTDEVGRGRGKDYGSPVKVFQLPNGNVRITEQDGDQFVMKKSGYFDNLSDSPKQGAPYGGIVDAGYDKDLGVPHVYFGRGYVQVTWWYGYAVAGIRLGVGLDLLLNPEKVNEPAIAYQIMSNRMVRGIDVKGGKTLASFINGQQCDYVAARALVNPADTNREEVAGIAVKFELILREAVVKS